MATKPKMKLKKGDHVQVIPGKDIGKGARSPASSPSATR